MDSETIALVVVMSVFILIYFIKVASDLLSSPVVSTKFILAAIFWPLATVVLLFQSLSGKLLESGIHQGGTDKEELP